MAERVTGSSAPTDLRSRATVEILRELGYAVAWAEGGAACTVRGEDERFEGSGADAAAALGNALRAMLPTKVARASFDVQVDRRAAALSADTAPPRVHVETVRERPRPQMTTIGEGFAPSVGRGPSRMVVTTVGGGTPPILRPAPAPVASAVDPDAANRTVFTVEDALADLGSVRARIEDAVGEVALMAPTLQRAHVLAWISRARSIEEQYPTDRMVQHTTQNIARRLTHLCKIWWPGTVRALQLHTTVEQASRSVEPAPRPMPRRWAELAELLETRLDTAVNQPGFDDGWLDGSAQFPPAPDRPQLFAKIRATIERIAGSLTQPPVDRADSVRVSDGDVLELIEVSQRLRWLRASAPDAELWGAAVGRIRFLVTGLGDRGSAIKAVLDPGYRPRGTWHEYLNRAKREDILAARPAASEKDPLVAWLVGAFNTLPTKDLVPIAVDVKDAVLALAESDIPGPDRRLRRRLRDLQDALNEPADLDADTAAAAAAARAKSEAADSLEAAAAAEAAFETVTEKLLGQIRGRLPAQRALFVSNREDPELRERLQTALGLEITWCVADPRRVDAASKAIAKSAYDLVLSATGFQDHSTDAALSRACAASTPKVRYVRVNRGRIAACARALARELGIHD
jgi:hypothetical protein